MHFESWTFVVCVLSLCYTLYKCISIVWEAKQAIEKMQWEDETSEEEEYK